MIRAARNDPRMSFLEFLHSIGFELPSPAYVAGLVIFGIVGAVAWYRGRKLQRRPVKWLGLALMLYPYATPQTWLLYAVGAALTAGLVFAWNRGVA
jgi:hypothetical protein